MPLVKATKEIEKFLPRVGDTIRRTAHLHLCWFPITAFAAATAIHVGRAGTVAVAWVFGDIVRETTGAPAAKPPSGRASPTRQREGVVGLPVGSSRELSIT